MSNLILSEHAPHGLLMGVPCGQVMSVLNGASCLTDMTPSMASICRTASESSLTSTMIFMRQRVAR